MRKHNNSKGQPRPNDQVLNKKLSSSEIKEIITKIFMNKALMDNYVDIDEEGFKTID